MKRTITVWFALIIVVPVFSQETSEIESDAAHLSSGLQKGSNWVAEIGAGLYAEMSGGCGSIDIKISRSHQFNPYISAGIGTGWTLYTYGGGYYGYGYHSGEGSLVPVFMDFTLNVLNRKVSPFLKFRGGYSFYLNEDNGFFVNPSVGITLHTARKFAIHVGVDSEVHFEKWLTFGLNVGLSF